MTQILFGERISRKGQIRVGCAALLFDPPREKILLTRRADNGMWCLPSGGIEPGESASEACERETLEETGLVVKVKRLVGVNSNPNRLVIYADDSRFQIVGLCFEVERLGGEMGLSSETTQIGFFTPAEIEAMDLLDHHRQYILDALSRQEVAVLR